MDFKYNDVITRSYKNAEIEIVVEDDVITTAKTYIDGKCVSCDDITTADGKDVAYSRANYEQVLAMCKADIDLRWEENFAAITR